MGEVCLFLIINPHPAITKNIEYFENNYIIVKINEKIVKKR